ncbi:glucose-6-phosphate dehydrogenase [uncultured Nitrospira sp.]|uniref:glucose-6-phosphate dehydrogenase n=1 Tax=uncultured Nitrospira sp. TaxID=157176 RepID=UPI0031408B43
MYEHLVIFGATGDVTKRFVFPALAQVFANRGPHTEYRITGVGRRDWTTPQFQEHVSESLGKHQTPSLPRSREEFLQSLEYARVEDLSDAREIASIFHEQAGLTLLYLGLPPQMFPSVLEAFRHVTLPPRSRVIIEKPFGLNHAQSRELNRLLHQKFPEESVFRVDHFLGMPMVGDILGLRFTNPVFTPIWNRHHIKKIEVICDETLALEGRAEYYDCAGALKDMIQSHLLQLMTVLALEPMESIWAPEFRDKRVELFKAIRKPSKAEIRAQTVRARYRSGEIRGVRVPGYVKNKGVVSERNTETFAQVTLWVDNERWQGVPFVLRSGKALGRDRKEILVHFKNGQRNPESQLSEEGGNVLRLNLASEKVNLGIFTIQEAGGITPAPMGVDDPNSPEHLSPYERLFLEAMSDKTRLFVRNDEVEEMWNIIQPVADAWAENVVPLQIYRAGSNGPPMEDIVALSESQHSPTKDRTTGCEPSSSYL